MKGFAQHRRAQQALATLAWLAFAAASQAQDATAPEGAPATGSLPAVNVTAKGYAASDVETPIATSVLGAEDLERKQAQNLGEALRDQPGLSVSLDGAQGQNPVIRGLQKDSVVLLVDGMRLNSAQPAGAIASFMSLGLAERVEVVKGPASVLYGTGALGGAINVRLPQARFETGLQLRTQLGYDSASRAPRAAAVANFSTGDHALMLGASLARPHDYRAPGGRVARTGYDSDALIGQYRYRIDADQQLRLSLQRQQDRDVWYPGSTRPHPVPAVGSLTIHSPKQTRTLYELGYSRSASQAQPLGLDLRIYRQQMQRQVNGWANGLARDISVTDVGFVTDGLDARAEWLAHPRHLLSLGVNAWQMRADPDSLAAAPPLFNVLAPNKPFTRGRLRALGFYVQDDMQFGALKVLAGLRHDTVRGRAAALNNGSVTSGLDRSDSALSGSVGVLYEFTPLLRPYASVARGFRAADLRERYQNGPRQDGFYWAGSPQVAPEKATQFELGLKGESDALQYGIALWRNRISHYITGMQLTGADAVAACGPAMAAACKQTVNLGHASLTGADAWLRWRVHPDHWLSASYSRVRGTNGDLHEPLFQMPADTLALGWEGRVAPRWTLDARALLVRRQNRVATRFTRGSEDPTAGYGVVDVGATWHYRREQSLRIAIMNLGDKRYHEHLAEGLPGMEPRAPGRSLRVSWEGRF